MESKAVGAFEKNFRHPVPWCEIDCGEMKGAAGKAAKWNQDDWSR